MSPPYSELAASEQRKFGLGDRMRVRPAPSPHEGGPPTWRGAARFAERRPGFALALRLDLGEGHDFDPAATLQERSTVVVLSPGSTWTKTAPSPAAGMK